jgi:ABC-type transport system involved in cytochrome bd biosynthesis fused ATPase/permease subunit
MMNSIETSQLIKPYKTCPLPGTLRFNLDPLSQCSSDAQLWQALERSHLSEHVARLARDANCASGLESVVQEQGKNFSLGYLDGKMVDFFCDFVLDLFLVIHFHFV